MIPLLAELDHAVAAPPHTDQYALKLTDAPKIIENVLLGLATGSAAAAVFDGLEPGHPMLDDYTMAAYPMRGHDNGVIASEIGGSGILALLTARGCTVSLMRGRPSLQHGDLTEQFIDALATVPGELRRGIAERPVFLEQGLPGMLVLGMYAAFCPQTDLVGIVRTFSRQGRSRDDACRDHLNHHALSLAQWMRGAALHREFDHYDKDARKRVANALAAGAEYGVLAASAELSSDPLERVIEQAFVGLQHLIRTHEIREAGKLVLNLGGGTEVAGALYGAVAGLYRSVTPTATWHVPRECWAWLGMAGDDQSWADRSWKLLSRSLLRYPPGHALN